MEQENNKKKMILPMVLGITVLSILVLGATYAYFTVGTSNNFGSKIITANTPEIGSVTLSSGESLSLNMTSESMMEENIGKYYATTTGVPSTTLTEVDIATATVTGSGNFNCTYDLTITPSATNSLYTAFTGMTGHDSNQIVLKVGSHTYDFNTTDFGSPITINESFSNLTSSASGSIKASLKFVNTSFDQNDLQGKDITFTFTASNLSCTAIDYRTATFDIGRNVENKMFTLAKGPTNISSFERSTSLPSEYESSEYEIQSNASDEKIYMWYDNGTIKYYTKADKIYLNENSSYMFAGCSALTSLDLSNFDTSNVTNMTQMFSGASALTSINLSNFNTSNVTSMNSMFGSCSSLTSLDLSTFDTSNVTDMSGMFGSLSNLTSLDLSSFETTSLNNTTNMFYNIGATIGYARTQADADKLNSSSNKPSSLIFNIKIPIDKNKLVGNFVTLDNESGIYYRVLYKESSVNNSTYMLLRMNNDLGDLAYNTTSTTVEFENGSSYQKYAGSTLDTYMNETYYNTLSTNIKNAIVDKNIYEGVYSRIIGTPSGEYYMKGTYGTNSTAYWIGYVSKVNVGTRHVYALDAEDILKYLGKDNLSMSNINNMFFNTSGNTVVSQYIWLRSAYTYGPDSTSALVVYSPNGDFNSVYFADAVGVRPAFLIDLSKVDFEAFKS